MNTKHITDLNVRFKTIKWLEDRVGENVDGLGLVELVQNLVVTRNSTVF